MNSISSAEAAKLLESIRIPPRPTILTELMAERDREDPDLRKIAQIVSRDVVLSAAMLKTVNSPFFGLRRKLDSIDQAVMTMGSKNVLNIMTGLALRNMNVDKNLRLERFWDTAERTACVSAMLAKRLPGMQADLAYTVGLFHDCGIPLMMSRFPDYKDILHEASSRRQSVTSIEEAHYNTNHATVGYLLAKNWNLSETIALTILHHHDMEIFTSGESLPEEVRGLVAVIEIAEAISDTSQMRSESSWENNAALLTGYLGITPRELDDLTEEVLSMWNE